MSQSVTKYPVRPILAEILVSPVIKASLYPGAQLHTNSVINGKQPPIQMTVTDVEKCFDKLWLQATINELFEAGLYVILQFCST